MDRFKAQAKAFKRRSFQKIVGRKNSGDDEDPDFAALEAEFLKYAL